MASKRRLRRNACIGKQSHPTKEGAIIAAKKHAKAFGFKMNAYKCGYCNGWHIGHPKV